MLLTDKYADKIYGTITCYDRMIIQGYIPGWSHAEGMTGYLNANNIRIFDFSNFSQPLTEQIRANAQRIADENGIEIEFIRKLRAFRKDVRIQEIIQETGKTEGLIHIFPPWNSAILTNPGMTRPRERHSLSLTRANVSIIISISLTKNWGSVTFVSLPGRLSACSSI